MNQIDHKVIQRLVDASLAALSLAYNVGPNAPRYGAAVLCGSGKIYSAGQYKAETRQISLHAEQAALVHAACHGEAQVVAIAITSNENSDPKSFTNPCGICKQAIYEQALVSHNDISVILVNAKREYKLLSIHEMNQYPWPANL